MYWKDADLEVETAARIAEYEQRLGHKVVPPVPLESIAETLFDLTLLYQVIEEQSGLQILGGLSVAEKTIVINEKHLPEFRAKPGRERFTLAHEIGHWDLYEQRRSNRQGDFFGGESAKDTRMVCRSAGGLDVKVLKQAWVDDDVHLVESYLRRKRDDAVEGPAVDRYAAALLLPKRLLLPAYEPVEVHEWRDLGPLADQFGVTLSTLSKRLQKMGKLHVREDGRLFKCSAEEYSGQTSIF